MSRFFEQVYYSTRSRGERRDYAEKTNPHSPRFLRALRVSALQCAVLFALPASLLAQQADWIWSGRYVITEDAQHRVIENGAVAIRGERIVGVGTKAEID